MVVVVVRSRASHFKLFRNLLLNCTIVQAFISRSDHAVRLEKRVNAIAVVFAHCHFLFLSVSDFLSQPDLRKIIFSKVFLPLVGPTYATCFWRGVDFR